MDNLVPYHCPKCRSSGQQVIFSSLPELRQHILSAHLPQDPSSFAGASVPKDTIVPISTSKTLSTPLKTEPRGVTDYKNVQGLSDPEQLAQAKRYLLKEAMKSSELNREQMRKLNEEIKVKESNLDVTSQRLNTLTEKNQNMEEEFAKIGTQNSEIRQELDDLKNKLMEKEKLLEDKNKELADQLNFVKSIEDKEALAKEKLERTVAKIIERAETAEKNLELMRLSAANNNTEVSIPSKSLQKEADSMQRSADLKSAELQNVLESCNTASNVTYQKASQNHQEPTAKTSPNDAKDTSVPLVQVYLKNFLEKYNELKAREFAFNQTFPSLSVPAQNMQPQIYVTPSVQGHYSTGMLSQEFPETDGSRYKQTPASKHNLNNSNNYYTRPNSKQTLDVKRSRSPVFYDYDEDADDDDDDEPLTEVSAEIEEEEAFGSTPRSRSPQRLSQNPWRVK